MAIHKNTSESILIVEDNPTTAKNLRLFLESEGFAVTVVDKGQECISIIKQKHFHLMLLDLMLPDMDGIDICKEVRQSIDFPILMLTAKTTEDEIVEGLEAGADDYICKPFGFKELLARIRRCLRAKESKLTFISIGDMVLNIEKRHFIKAGTLIKLTKSEFDILELFFRNPGRVFTREQIISKTLGLDYDGFDRTIDTHIWSIRRKIGEPKGAPKYLRSEVGIGYRLVDS